MINYFGLTLNEMGIGKLEFAVIGVVTIIFPILFVIASINLDSKGVFDWMLEKPDDWIGKNKIIIIYDSNFNPSKLAIGKSYI